ncbi:RnaseH-domain-containing protein, partial [Trametes cingulata]
LHVVSDSKYVVDGLTLHLPKWERAGWLGVANKQLFQELVARLRARSAPTSLRWVKGHSRVAGNEEADRLAKQGAMLPQPFRPCRPRPPVRYLQNGMSLAHLTQKMAYKAIRSSKSCAERSSTKANMNAVRNALHEKTGISVTENAVWTLLRKDPVQRKVRDFLWKALHGAYRVGRYWENIPSLEGRAKCAVCGVEESMEHILTTCRAVGQREAWCLARALLEKRAVPVGEISLGIGLGGHAFTVTNGDGGTNAPATRLARIVLTETARLVWALRCERVIGREGRTQHTRAEVENKWRAVINRRLSTDMAITNVRTCGKRAIPRDMVLKTWSGTLEQENALPDDWIGCPGVLVGRLYAQ